MINTALFIVLAVALPLGLAWLVSVHHSSNPTLNSIAEWVVAETRMAASRLVTWLRRTRPARVAWRWVRSAWSRLVGG